MARNVACNDIVDYELEPFGDMHLEKIVLPAGLTRKVDVYLKGRAYPIKTNVDRDPAQQVEDIKKTLGFLDQRGITPQYIDVRVSGRAFYL